MNACFCGPGLEPRYTVSRRVITPCLLSPNSLSCLLTLLSVFQLNTVEIVLFNFYNSFPLVLFITVSLTRHVGLDNWLTLGYSSGI